MPTDEHLAAISELAARYFRGWEPKTIGKRRFPAFEKRVREAFAATNGREGEEGEG